MDSQGGTGHIQAQPPVTGVAPEVPLQTQVENDTPGQSEPVSSSAESQPLMQWQASEFIDHEKTFSWFILLCVGGAVVSGLVYLVSRSIFSALVVLMATLTFGVFARKKPRTLTYLLFPYSLRVDGKDYSFDEFRSFSIIQDGALYNILLEPIKRFMLPITIYFAPQDGESIFDILAQHLPHEERKADPVEQLMRKIRF